MLPTVATLRKQVNLIGSCRDTVQFVWVGDYIYLLDMSIHTIQRQDKVRQIIDVRDHTGPPIDGGRTHREAVSYIEFAPHAEYEAHHLVRTMERMARRKSLAATVSISDDIVSKQGQEAVHIAPRAGAAKLVQEGCCSLEAG
jgi:hypothetical protein